MSVEKDPFDLSAGVPAISGEMRPKPKIADRISKRVLVVVFASVGLIVLVFLAALDNMDQKKPVAVEAKKEDKSADAPAKAPDELTGAGSSSPTGGKPAPSLVPQIPPASAPAASVPAAGSGGVPYVAGMSKAPAAGQQNAAGATAGEKPTLTPAQQAAEQDKIDRLNRLRQARTGGLGGKSFDAGEEANIANAAAKAPVGQSPGVGDMALPAALLNAATRNAAAAQQNQPGTDQDEKMEFMKSAAKDDRTYHPHVPIPPLSVDELKPGSFIPGILQQSINSDLPGRVTARVSEAVWDTRTGCHMLIPPMAVLFGTYDSKVALGQGRNLIVWNDLIFPDGSELNLAGMGTYDTSGASGLEADVDNHYLRTFGIAFGMSLVGVPAQLNASSTSNANQTQTPSQAVATALTQQFGQLGAQVLGRYLSVQPTLRNFVGEQFNIVVPQTIIFKKVWRDRCGGATAQ